MSLLALFVFTLSCTTYKVKIVSSANPSLEELEFTVGAAEEWNKLFNRSEGWFGGDGIFTIPFSGEDTAGAEEEGKTLVLFSDSIIGETGEVKEGKPFQMINNSVAILEGAEPKDSAISFHWPTKENGDAASIFVPQTKASKPGEYFWLGDGFVNQEKGNDVYLFAYRIQKTDAEVFPFKEVGNVLIIIPNGSNPPFSDYRQIDTPFYMEGSPESTGSFGSGILVNTKSAGAINPDGFVYIYGVKGVNKEVLVARVQPKRIEKFSSWRFWDGEGWQKDMLKAMPIADRASNELSVNPLKDGRYAMVFQKDAIGTEVGLRLGLSPKGPFGPVISIWDAAEDLKHGIQLISYNAKAHPNLSGKNELLISYNINSFDFFSAIKDQPNLYRPRFIRLIIEE
jgi:hypothetical protein